MSRLLFSAAIALLRGMGNYCMRRYRSPDYDDRWYQAALALYYAETQTRIAEDKIRDAKANPVVHDPSRLLGG
jgi:hypothetical protein